MYLVILAHLALAKWPWDVVPGRPKHEVSILPGLVGALFLHPLSWSDFLRRCLMQLGSILGSNLGLCGQHFSYLLPLESRSYLEAVLALIFHRFLDPLGLQKQSFRIANNIIS